MSLSPQPKEKPKMNAPNENNEDANVVKFSDWDKERIAELFYKRRRKR